MTGTITPASLVLVGAAITMQATGTITTAGATPVLTLDDGTSRTITLPGDLNVLVREQPLPTTAGSVGLCSVNGGALETVVLRPNASGVLRWFRVVVGAFITGIDVVTGAQVLYIAPPPVVAARRTDFP